MIDDILSRFEAVTATGDGWVGRCPVPSHGRGDGDSNPSLRLAVGESGKVLIKCRAGCPTGDVLSAVGLSWADLSDAGDPTLPIRPPAPTETQILLHDSQYQALFDWTQLSPHHKKYLLDRGVPHTSLVNYRTIRSWYRADFFRSHDLGGDLAPGLCWEKWPTGLAIAVRDEAGRIRAVKVRSFGDGPRYFWWSSPSRSCGSHLHFPPGKPRSPCMIRVTEGEIKADVATALGSMYTVSVPGVTQWRPYVEWLKREYDAGNRHATLVSFDWPDVRENPAVRGQLREFLKALRSLKFGHQYHQADFEVWDSDEKGIDDHLLKHGLGGVSVANDEYAWELLDSLEPRVPISVPKNRSAEVPGPTVTSRWASFDRRIPFPLDFFPDGVRGFVEDSAENKCAAVEFPAFAALSVACAAVGASRSLKVKRHENWRVYPTLYAVLVDEPGSGKTPSMEAFVEPVVELDREAWKRSASRHADWEAERKENPKECGPKPPWEQIVVEDFTTESLISNLNDNPRGLFVYPDEILGWLKSLDKYRPGNDRQFYLKVWGSKPYKQSRKTESSNVYLATPILVILGSIQPDVLPDLLCGPDGRFRNDGFVDRFLFAYPDNPGSLSWSTSPPREDFSPAWRAAVRRLYALSAPDHPGPVLMTDEAYDEFDRLASANALETREPGFPRHLRGYWSKTVVYAARFTLAHHYLKWSLTAGEQEGPVETDSVRSAWALTEFFKGSFIHVLGNRTPDEEWPQIAELCRFVWARHEGRAVTLRQVTNAKSPDLPRKARAVRDLFIAAADNGLGDYHPKLDGQKDVFTPNPESRLVAETGLRLPQ